MECKSKCKLQMYLFVSRCVKPAQTLCRAPRGINCTKWGSRNIWKCPEKYCHWTKQTFQKLFSLLSSTTKNHYYFPWIEANSYLSLPTLLSRCSNSRLGWKMFSSTFLLAPSIKTQSCMDGKTFPDFKH